jgi:membrane protein implicated in regulation of membrane protease activity
VLHTWIWISIGALFCLMEITFLMQ